MSKLGQQTDIDKFGSIQTSRSGSLEASSSGSLSRSLDFLRCCLFRR